MNCKRCDVEMNLYHPQDGSYFLCPSCNKVEYPLHHNAGKEDKDKDQLASSDSPGKFLGLAGKLAGKVAPGMAEQIGNTKVGGFLGF